MPNLATPALSDTLATIYTHGGLCRDDRAWVATECVSMLTIARDGRALLEDTTLIVSSPGVAYGVLLPDAGVAKLARLIASTDWSTVRTGKFTGTCPTAYDASEVVLTFYTPKGEERIASCTSTIDWNTPLLQTLTELQRQVNSVRAR